MEGKTSNKAGVRTIKQEHKKSMATEYFILFTLWTEEPNWKRAMQGQGGPGWLHSEPSPPPPKLAQALAILLLVMALQKEGAKCKCWEERSKFTSDLAKSLGEKVQVGVWESVFLQKGKSLTI